MLAAVNPCGFALLPAYVSLLLASDDSPGRGAAVVRALVLTAAMTTGFAGVFALFGLVIAPVASGVQQHLPWFTVVLGIGLALMGVWMLAGRSLALPRLPRRRGGTRPKPLSRSFGSMVGFGASYAVASLSCTVAPFLAVVVGGFRSGSAIDGLGLFLSYAAGMGLVVGTLAVATALASPTTVAGLRRAGRWTPRVAGGLLAGAGAYVAYYGAWELRVLAGGDPRDPVIDGAANLQQALARFVDEVGALGWTAVLAVLLTAAGAVALRRHRRRSAARTGPAQEPVGR